MFTVYKHTSPSGKIYIGITSQSVEKRWNSGYGYITNDHLWKAIQKYGWKSFKHEIIATNLSKEEACSMEMKLIAKYNSMNPDYGYNISQGGETPGFGIPCSEEKKRKISESRLGERHWFYGKHLSEEHKRKIGEAGLGRHHTSETKLKQKEIATKLRGKSVLCVERNIIYPSIAEAARLSNTNRHSIIHVLRGNHKTAGGYHWKYASTN